jgi:hypothetical protein
MNQIKSDLFLIGKLLQDPNEVKVFWDYLLPNIIFDWFPSIRTWLVGSKFKKMAPCRIIIFVDDLDRCPPEKCSEVLQTLILLTENSPFIIFLAVDPRIVVSAIESANKSFYRETGVNGYEYLDKIVQVKNKYLEFLCINIFIYYF